MNRLLDRAAWRAVYESSIVRGLAVTFALVSCVLVGLIIARVTA